MKQFQYRVTGFKVTVADMPKDKLYEFTLAIPKGAQFRDVYGYTDETSVGVVIYYEYRMDRENDRELRKFFLLPSRKDAAITTHPDARYDYLGSLNSTIPVFLYEVKDA